MPGTRHPMDLKKKILKILESGEKPTARELARQIGREKSEVNSVLYTLKSRRRANVDSELRWSLLGKTDGSDFARAPDSESVSRPAETSYSAQPSTPVSRSEAIVWTPEQNEVVTAPSDRLFLVDSGPGTGKTAVACARVAHLLGEGIPASQVLMVSFTRAAVHEIKQRIGQHAGPEKTWTLRIATLDQTAFSLGIGVGQEFETLMQGFEENIDNAIRLLSQDAPAVKRFLGGLRHVLVDEAQDITGPRIDLITSIFDSLPSGCGITVFADPAQSIYGFTSDDGDDDTPAPTFLTEFPFDKRGFKRVVLGKNHRASTTELADAFERTRALVLREEGGAYSAKPNAEEVLDEVRRTSVHVESEIAQIQFWDGDFVLYRKRVSALNTSQFFPKPHKLRLPGYPSALRPWLAIALSAHTDRSISEAVFAELWDKKAAGRFDADYNAGKAWQLMRLHAPSRVHDVDLRKLRALLSLPRPPVEFCLPDYGLRGPVFSTIHASKGREAQRVFMMLPRTLEAEASRSEQARAEEARVYYVGFTRSKRDVFHGTAQTMRGVNPLAQSSQRVVKLGSSIVRSTQMQFGLDGDIRAFAGVSREVAADSRGALLAQSKLVHLWETLERGESLEINSELSSRQVGEKKEYFHRILAGKDCIAITGDRFNRDLWTVTKHAGEAWSKNLRPPDKISYLKMLGVMTVSLDPDSPLDAELCEPFASSGFALQPMLAGFPRINFKYRRS